LLRKIITTSTANQAHSFTNALEELETEGVVLVGKKLYLAE